MNSRTKIHKRNPVSNKRNKPNQTKQTNQMNHFRHHHLLTANSSTRPRYHLLAVRILKVYSLGKFQTRHTPSLVMLTGPPEVINLIIPGSYPLTNISHSQLPEPRELPFYSMSTSLFFLSTHEILYSIYFPMNRLLYCAQQHQGLSLLS